MGGSVLIVDDDAGFRALAARMITAAGLTVAGEADDAASALAAATSFRPDGVLVDVGLPGRDGIALARDLAALAWRPRVLLTSSDSEVAHLVAGAVDGIPFVLKEDLPNAPLATLLAA